MAAANPLSTNIERSARIAAEARIFALIRCGDFAARSRVCGAAALDAAGAECQAQVCRRAPYLMIRA